MRETILAVYSLYLIFICAYICTYTINLNASVCFFNGIEVMKANANFSLEENAQMATRRNDLLGKPENIFLVIGNKQNSNIVFEPAFSDIFADK